MQQARDSIQWKQKPRYQTKDMDRMQKDLSEQKISPHTTMRRKMQT